MSQRSITILCRAGRTRCHLPDGDSSSLPTDDQGPADVQIPQPTTSRNQLLQLMKDLRSSPNHPRREDLLPRRPGGWKNGEDLEPTLDDYAADDGGTSGPATQEVDALNYNLPARQPRRVTIRLTRPCSQIHASETRELTPAIVFGLMPLPGVVIPNLG